MEEMSLAKNSNHTLNYCRTERLFSTYTYTWDITNFWHEYMMLPLNSPRIESQFFYFQLNADDKKEYVEFRILLKEWHPGSCHIFLKNTVMNFYKVISVRDTTDELLCSIPIIYLLENAAKCLPNNTLTMCFECKWYDVVDQTIMCTNLQLNEKVQINSSSNNDIVPDKESFVIFVIGNKKLYANKNLICAKSSVLNNMLNCQIKEKKSNEVRITDITSDILKLFLSYIQFDIFPNFEINEIYTLSELFIVANRYDVQDLKFLCELQLIKLIDVKNYMEFLDIGLTWLHNTIYLENYIKKLIQIQPKNIYNSQLIELNEENVEAFFNIANYIKINRKICCSIDIHKVCNC